ncbi:MAG: hypothetical protein WDO73_31235 [Ignavibacteriota bacterium]
MVRTGMLDESDIVALTPDRLYDGALETREAIHQRWHAAYQPGTIPERSRSLAASRWRQLDYGGAADKSGWQRRERVGRSRLAKEDEVDRAGTGEVVDEGGGAQCASAGQRIGGFGRKDEGGLSGQHGLLIDGSRRTQTWRARSRFEPYRTPV